MRQNAERQAGGGPDHVSVSAPTGAVGYVGRLGGREVALPGLNETRDGHGAQLHRLTCGEGGRSQAMVKYGVEGMVLLAKEDRLSIGCVVSEI